jgi:hypothetical protein
VIEDMEKARRPYSEEKMAANPDPVNKGAMFFDHAVS